MSSMSHDITSNERAEQLPSSVRLDFLEAIRPSLLLKVLAPHTEFFRRRSVDLDAVTLDDALHARLYELLNAEDPEVPEQLRRTIMHLTAMSSDVGFDALVDAAEQQGEEGFVERAARLNKHELAVDTYLRLPQVFSAARGRVRSQLPQRYIEYYPRRQASLDDYQLRERLEPFEAVLRKHFAKRTGSDYCRILSAPRREHELLVCHAGAPRLSTCILPNGQRARDQGWTEERDEVILDRQTGRMAIRAESPADREFYKRAVGQTFFGDDACFAGGAVYTGAPLLEQGFGALGAGGIDGLRRVELLEVRLRGRGIERTWIRPDAAVFSSAEWARAKVRAEVYCMRLALHLSHRPYPAQVEIVPPNTIIFDRRFVARYAYAFLLRRGFMLRHAACA
jgi:hypothetical protein